MTISEWLVDSMVKLKKAEVPGGRTDCLVLLADLFQKDKSWVHAHPEYELDDLQIRELNYKLQKRIDRTPLAYIRGFADFYGRRFTVNSNVLIPRPESENLIELLKTLELETPRIADIGTGSGCLGITAALEIPDATVHLYDISKDALAMAEHNALQYRLDLQFYESDLLKNLKTDRPYDILLVNLPYVPDSLITSPEIKREPSAALFAGKTGLNIYREFWQQVGQMDPNHKPRYILAESLKGQHSEQSKFAGFARYRPVLNSVLVQVFELNQQVR